MKPMRLHRRLVKSTALVLGLVMAIAMASAAGASAAIVAPPLSPIAQAAAAIPAAPPVVPAPANDERANAQAIHSLPASINGTTVGATLEPGESQSSCGVPTTTPSGIACAHPAERSERIALDLAAGGELDATIDVYHAVRSQLDSVGCQQTESHGKASLSFKASKNGLYEIRVAALASSQLASFSLEVFLPTPAVGPPGARCHAGGVSGRVDRIQNINAAYSFTMHSGVSYLISLANETERRVRQRRAVRARHELLRRRRRRIWLRLRAAADRLRRLQSCSPPAPARAGATASSSPRATPSAASSASTCRSLRRAPRNGARAGARQLRPRARAT